MQMWIWTDAEVAVQEELMGAAERLVEARQEYWAELELERKLGN